MSNKRNQDEDKETSRKRRIPLDQMFSKEALDVATINDEFIEFFVDQRSPVWHGLRSRISLQHPASVRRMTGSILATIVGLSRKSVNPRDLWRAWTGRLREGESDKVESNEDMAYGTFYEPMVRWIFARLVTQTVREPGFYVDIAKPHFGVSPDGITGPLTVTFDDSRGGVVRVDMGRTILEIKCSMRLLRGIPQIEHLVQMHLEMYITRTRWGWLFYWHCHAVRLWIVEFNDEFWAWIARRAEAFLDACITDLARGTGIQRTPDDLCNLPEDSQTMIGFEMQDEWFGAEEAALRGKRFYPVSWSRQARKIKLPLSAKPRIDLVFEDETKRDPARMPDKKPEDGSENIYPLERKEDDPWLAENWATVAEEQTRKMTPRTKKIFFIEG